MNRRANLTKLVKIGNNWTYRKPVYTKKTGMLTNRVRHNGKDAELGGSFVLRWYENGQRRRRNLRTGDTLVAISELRKLQKLQEARADGVPVAESPQPGKQSLRQAVEEFLEEVRVNKAKKTWQAFKQVLETFVATCPHATVESITRRDVMVHFVGALQDQGLSDRTQFHRFACLVSFLKASKCTVVTLKDAPDYTETKISVYTQDELKAFFAACDPDDRLLAKFLLFTGAREQEAQYAEWTDILFDKKIFHIHSKPKMGFKIKDREERRVPIPDSLVADLKEVKKHRSHHLIFPANCGRPDGHLIRRIKNVAYKAKLNCGKCVGRTGLKCSAGPTCKHWKEHTFRHTFATMHLRAGVDVRTVQHWMGHSSLATTMKYLDYLRAESESTREKVNATFAGL